MNNRDLLSIASTAKLPEPDAPNQAWNLAMQAIEKKDMVTASRFFQKVADAGEWQGQYMLAVTALASSSSSKVDEALVHMDAAATAGHKSALLGLAILLLNTSGEVQRKRAVVILQRLVDENDDLSKIVLGLALRDEIETAGGAEFTVEKLWASAAEREWVWAMQLLADKYFSERKTLSALKWKWRAFTTTFRLAKVDSGDVRLTNAT
jgi:TPR repeat protein